MADRKVDRTGKDADDDITRLCGPSYVSVLKSEAVSHIRNRTHTYYVQEPGTQRADVHVTSAGHLRTDPDGDPKNNLEDC